MDLGLKDRVAIIGGSSRGMGRAIAVAFAHEGANVTVCARGEADLRRTELELSRISSQAHVLAVPADLSQLRDIRRVVRDTLNRFGRIGVLVTHVGYGPATGRPSEFEDETIMQTMEGNFLSAVRLAKEVVPFMKQQHWGRIVNLLPELSLRLPDGAALATSSQLALVGYSKMLANELAPFNITVNNLVSGPVETDFLKGELDSRAAARGRHRRGAAGRGGSGHSDAADGDGRGSGRPGAVPGLGTGRLPHRRQRGAGRRNAASRAVTPIRRALRRPSVRPANPFTSTAHLPAVRSSRQYFRPHPFTPMAYPFPSVRPELVAG